VPIRRLMTLQTPVFLLNSRLDRFSATPFPFRRTGGQVPEAPLLPKLRGHFAEFLLHRSLEHLRLLASPTCVRFRYGHESNSPPRLFPAVGLNSLGRTEVPPRTRRSASTSFIPWNYLPPWTGTTAARLNLRSCVPPVDQRRLPWCRIVRLLSIDYAFRPRLRSRLTRGG
jgi:hypothetical protein